MMRKTYGTLLTIAAAALMMVGCGKEDVTDLSDAWTKKEGDVMTKLEEVRTRNTELMGRLQAVNTSSITDSSKIADRAMVETTLNEYMTKIGEVEASLNSLKAKRDSAATLGNRGEFEAMWKSAEADYTAAMGRLEEMENDYNNLANRLDALTTASTAIDTAASVNANDTAKTSESAGAKSDATKTEESASKEDATKADDNSTEKAEKKEESAK